MKKQNPPYVWNKAGWKVGDRATLNFKKPYYFARAYTNKNYPNLFDGAIKLCRPNLVEIINIQSSWNHMTVKLLKEDYTGTALQSYKFLGLEPYIYLGGDEINILKPLEDFEKILHQRDLMAKEQSVQALKENAELAKPTWKRLLNTLLNALKRPPIN